MYAIECIVIYYLWKCRSFDDFAISAITGVDLNRVRTLKEKRWYTEFITKAVKDCVKSNGKSFENISLNITDNALTEFIKSGMICNYISDYIKDADCGVEK